MKSKIRSNFPGKNDIAGVGDEVLRAFFVFLAPLATLMMR